MSTQKKARRVLLKLSGEALANGHEQALSPEKLKRFAEDIQKASQQGVQVAVVIGAGNFLRGATTSNKVITRTTADHMGMLATILNALAFRDALEATGQTTRLYSAQIVPGVTETFDYRRAIDALEQGYVALMAGGTGNPFVTTDSAASLRAIELDADVLLKATGVNGVYSADPKKDSNATHFEFISYAAVIKNELAVMDLAAFCQCRDYNIPIRVFNLFKENALVNALTGTKEGTLVAKEEPVA